MAAKLLRAIVPWSSMTSEQAPLTLLYAPRPMRTSGSSILTTGKTLSRSGVHCCRSKMLPERSTRMNTVGIRGSNFTSPESQYLDLSGPVPPPPLPESPTSTPPISPSPASTVPISAVSLSGAPLPSGALHPTQPAPATREATTAFTRKLVDRRISIAKGSALLRARPCRHAQLFALLALECVSNGKFQSLGRPHKKGGVRKRRPSSSFESA